MKKIKLIFLTVFLFSILVSCGGDKKDTETSDTISDEDADTTNTTDAADSVSDDDTASGDTATDSGTPETPDSGPDEPEKNAEGCYIFTVDNQTFERWGYVDTFLGDVKDNI